MGPGVDVLNKIVAILYDLNIRVSALESDEEGQDDGRYCRDIIQEVLAMLEEG